MVNTKDRIGKKMLDAIKELGDYVKEKEKLSDVEIFIENPPFSETEGRLICLNFKKLEGKYDYISCHAEDITENKLTKCLYTESGAQKTKTFSLNIRKTNVESTVGKIERWFNNHKDENELIESIYNAFINQKANIISDLKGVLSSGRYIITIKIINNQEKFLGEIEEIQRLFKRDNIHQLYQRKFGVDIESKGTGTCFLCNNNAEVYGFASPFGFYTVDKRGFSPYFEQKDTWKQLPICFDCAVSLRLGMKKFIDRHNSLSFRFIDGVKNNKKIWIRCYIIPKFIFVGAGERQKKSSISDFVDKLEFIERTTTGSTEDLSYEMEQEGGLIDVFSKQDDILKLCFLYYSKEQARMVVRSYVEEVPPSWIKQLRDAMEKVQNFSIFKEEALKQIIEERHVGDIKFKRLGIVGTGRTKPFVSAIRDFFPSSKTEGTHDKYFMDVVSSILSRKPIDKDFMISAFVDRIRSAYKERDGYRLKLLCLKALMLYLFVVKMNLLRGEKMGEEKTVEETEGEDLESKVKQFFEEYGFHNPAKRAAFSVGMLVDYLLWVQRSERGSGYGEEPFWSNLYGLILDEKKIKGLFPKALSKLRQYRKGYSALETVVSKYLAEAEQDWNISNDETSYYFALGMTLRRLFSKNKEEKKEEE